MNQNKFYVRHYKIFDITILLVLSIIVSIITYSYSLEFSSYNADIYDYASIARNLQRGQGLTSDFHFPLSLTFPFLQQVPQPIVGRSPLYPIVLSGFFYLTSISDQSIKVLGIIFYLLTIMMLYFVAHSMFNRQVAFFSSLFTMLTHHLFLGAVSGLTEPMVGFLMVFLLFFLFKETDVKNVVLSGIVLGLLYLTRNFFLLALPAVTYYVYTKNKNHVLLVVIAFLLTITPWLIRNYLLSGNPFFAIQHYGEIAYKTAKITQNVFAGITPMTFSHVLKNYPGQFIKGIIWYLTHVEKPYLFLINPLLFICIFIPKKDVFPGNLKFFTIILFCVIFPAFTLYSVHFRLNYFFIPLFTMLGTAKFAALFPLEPKSQKSLAAWLILGIVTMSSTLYYFYDFNKRNRFLDINGRITNQIHLAAKKIVQDEDIIAVDSCASFAWHADKKALLPPQDIEAFNHCYQILNFNYMLLVMDIPNSKYWLKTFRDLLKIQPENISLIQFPKGGYLIHWKRNPFT